MSIRQLFTDQVETIGSVKRFSFRIQLYDLNWHYFGSTEAEYPVTEGVVTEHPYVQFPQDIDDLGPEGDGLIWPAVIEIAIRRENLQ